jgi:rhodanese-related sulfurtransferase
MKTFLSLLLLLVLMQSAQADVKHIDNATLMSMLEAGVPIIDVRRPEEWKQTGIVEGSHLMTFFDKQGRYDVGSWLQELDKIAKPNEPFILICRTGNRTGTISNFLDKKLSYSRVINVQKGITYWIEKGHPTVKPIM